ncbi:hypothetical protein A2Z10_02955 [Candidatus Azambacteria bacterium RBG_16_47_10]|uniref:Uncharacterized protein n=1 Tax=Candidatus Azambacteria bacterium RBG_16_47_10 TaxID=1797292 RepID=A0A1F5B0T1_9BACT|nr:MAG: hypothetical protein A2Z10_02955 [Candidatus Azambacteria bacterium RBG_16_47_10]
MAKDRSAEMLEKRSKRHFGGAPLPYSRSGGSLPTKGEWKGLFRTWDLLAIMCGEWTKQEALLLLKNKRNAITPNGDSWTRLHCPYERRDEILQILTEEFEKLMFVEGEDGRVYIAADNKKHILVVGEEECYLLMHFK